MPCKENMQYLTDSRHCQKTKNINDCQKHCQKHKSNNLEGLRRNDRCNKFSFPFLILMSSHNSF